MINSVLSLKVHMKHCNITLKLKPVGSMEHFCQADLQKLAEVPVHFVLVANVPAVNKVSNNPAADQTAVARHRYTPVKYCSNFHCTLTGDY